MAPRRRSPVSTTWLTAAAAAIPLVVVVGAALATWAYYSSSNDDDGDSAAQTSSNSGASTTTRAATKSVPRTAPAPGPKSNLTLVTNSFPPLAILARLAAVYTLHLVLPHPVPSLPLAPSTPNSTTGAVGAGAGASGDSLLGLGLDPRRIIPHETHEGVVHIVRVIGGAVVFVRQTGQKQQQQQQQQQKEEKLKGARVPLDKLVRDVKTFVRGVVVLRLSSGGDDDDDDEAGDDNDDEERLQGEAARGVTLIRPTRDQDGWEALCDKLAA